MPGCSCDFSSSIVGTVCQFHCDGLRAAFDSGRNGIVLESTVAATTQIQPALTTQWRWLSMDNKIHARKNSLRYRRKFTNAPPYIITRKFKMLFSIVLNCKIAKKIKIYRLICLMRVKKFRGSFVSDFRRWWPHVKIIYRSHTPLTDPKLSKLGLGGAFPLISYW